MSSIVNYIRAFCSVSAEKGQLLRLDDPVKKGSIASPLDAILANMHFRTPKEESYWAANEYYSDFMESRGKAISREETRILLERAMRQLGNSPETKHVVDALGTLIVKERGRIFVAETLGIGKLGAPFGISSMGLYAGKRSIFIGRIVDPKSKTVCPAKMGTFIHESLHFLFNRIVNQKSSPVIPGSGEEKELDRALFLDHEHRLNRTDKISERFRSFENDKYYFPKKDFSVNHTMRVEGIVRIMHLIAEGHSRADVEAAAPNLSKFYFTYSKPLLERYAADNAELFKT